MAARVGLLVGRENTFPGPFIEAVNRKGASAGVTAEMAPCWWTASPTRFPTTAPT